jgi:hypothetical protein
MLVAGILGRILNNIQHPFDGVEITHKHLASCRIFYGAVDSNYIISRAV